ncbi:MAG: hypothetical protein ACO1N3_05110 [Gammaproteobacteria bacterium]
MPEAQPLRLTDVAKRVANNALENVICHSLGLLTANIFALSAAAVIETWSGFMAVAITGAVALYIPLVGLKKLLNTLHLITPLMIDVLDLAYIIASPVVGALILNWMFAWTLPVMACLTVAAIGGGVHLLFTMYNRPGNRQTSAQNQSTPNTTSAYAPRGGNMRHSIFSNDPFENDPFFNRSQYPGSNTTAPLATAVYVDGTFNEELDENGNPVTAITQANPL